MLQSKKNASWIIVLRLASESEYKNYLEEMGFHFEEFDSDFFVGILGKPHTRELLEFQEYDRALNFCMHYLRGFDCSVVMKPEFPSR